MGSRKGGDNDGASPGKIFVGGLAKDTSLETFTKYFEKYGEITDFVIMKDRNTGRPRGFGFITFADPSVVDTVMQEDHVINGKQVEIKRTIPKGSSQSNDFKTKKIFVGGIPTSVTEDEFKNFFSKYGNVVEHEIICDHATKRSRGFGFIVFENEKVVDSMLANGNMIDMEGTQNHMMERGPKYSAYADLRENKLRMEFEKLQEWEEIEIKPSPMKKQVEISSNSGIPVKWSSVLIHNRCLIFHPLY